VHLATLHEDAAAEDLADATAQRLGAIDRGLNAERMRLWVIEPLIIHTRAASADTLGIMREERAGEVGGVMHCFTESQAIADAALELGFHISFSGIVTFKNARDLQQVAATVPAERLLIETDAPYLAPVPHRGKTNEPAYVRWVAHKLAELRGVSADTIGTLTAENFRRLFKPLRQQLDE
jgi:TatD DNase family protein